jgi:phosphoglycerate dehydrogenase-like enzyme
MSELADGTAPGDADARATTAATFRVGVTRDLLAPGGGPKFDIGLDLLEGDPRVEWEFIPDGQAEVSPESVAGLDALLVFGPSVTARTLEGADRLALVARIGVGYDNVDLEACTRHGVMVTNTPDGVRLPMAHATMTYVLALSHRLFVKDRIVRDGDWDVRWDHIGIGLPGKVLGIVGLGNIGSAVAELAGAFGMSVLAYDPMVEPAAAAAVGARLASLDEVMAGSDFICVLCPLTDETHHLIGRDELRAIRPSAFFINAARGPVVEHEAIVAALTQGWFAGAALDVFEQEPLPADDRLTGLSNVILSPHAIGHTDELFRGCGRSACQSALDVASGVRPQHVVCG